MIDLGIKSAVKDWMADKYENWIKKPVEKRTEELEAFIQQQVNKASQMASTHSQKAKQTAYKPIEFYQQRPTFHRGLFWIAIALLIVLWIISGS
jgi:hypothetical protein